MVNYIVKMMSPLSQYNWINYIRSIGVRCNALHRFNHMDAEWIDIRVAKITVSGEPRIQYPLGNVTPHFFPVDHRSVLKNEIVFDFDSDDLDQNYENSENIANFLERENCMYFQGDHKGRSPHTHWFLRLDQVHMKKELFNALVDHVGADGADKMLVVSRHHLVRAVGGRKIHKDYSITIKEIIKSNMEV